MKHIPLNITEEQRINHKLLARYLSGLPEDYGKFDMSVFHIDKREWESEFYGYDEDTELNILMFEDIQEYQEALSTIDNVNIDNAVIVHESCNSVACAVGHGPIAGIKLSRS